MEVSKLQRLRADIFRMFKFEWNIGNVEAAKNYTKAIDQLDATIAKLKGQEPIRVDLPKPPGGNIYRFPKINK